MDYSAYLGALAMLLASFLGVVLYARYRPFPAFILPTVGFLFVNGLLVLLPGIALNAIEDGFFSTLANILEIAALLLLAAMFAGLVVARRVALLVILPCAALASVVIGKDTNFSDYLWFTLSVFCAATCLRHAINNGGHIRWIWLAFVGAFLLQSTPIEPEKIVSSFFEGQLSGSFFSFKLITTSIGGGLWLFGVWFWYRVETWERLTLRPLLGDRRFTSSRSISIIATILLVLVLGYPLLDLISRYLEEYRRDQLILQARIAASSLEQLPPPQIPISRDEIESKNYKQWKAMLSLIAKTGDYSFAYLLVWKEGAPVFLADSEEPGSADESVIGDIWEKIPKGLEQTIQQSGEDAVPAVVGPYRDEWGVWISAAVPVPGWTINSEQVWLVVDREAFIWQAANLRLRQAGLITITLLLSILIFSFALHRINVEARWRVAQSHQRLSLSLQGGNIIAWEYDPVHDRLQLQGEVERLGLTDVVPQMALKEFLALLPKESAEQLTNEWQKLNNQELGEIIVEFPLRAANELKRWASLIGKVLSHKGDGTPLLIAGTLQDITERKDWERRLREEKESADAANRAKSTFLATMSHEIRTPLNAIIGMSSLLCRQDLPPKAKDFVHTILDSGENLLSLINDILDYSKIEAGKIEIESQPFSLADLLQELERIFSQQAREKGVEFEVCCSGELAKLLVGDVTRIKQILMNLLSNAIKFTAVGKVTLEIVAVGKERVRFTVTDSGIGMSPAELAKLFQPFQQADSSITRRYGGSGLGLVISKRLAELMGGSISVSSIEGQGSEFSIEVPLPPAAEEATQKASPGGEKDIVSKEEPVLVPLRVLVAEDNPTNQKVIQAMFASLRQKVQIVGNGELAVKEAATNPFDLILLDIQMPVMDGLQAAKLIREAEAENKNHSLIIALTANAFKEDRQACMNAGMDDYYAKPIKLDQVRQLLKRAREHRIPRWDPSI